MMSFVKAAILEMGELIRELNLAFDSCHELRLEMLLAQLAGENLVHLDSLRWLPPYVSFWVEGNSRLLKFNPRTGKFQPFGSHL